MRRTLPRKVGQHAHGQRTNPHGARVDDDDVDVVVVVVDVDVDEGLGVWEENNKSSLKPTSPSEGQQIHLCFFGDVDLWGFLVMLHLLLCQMGVF